MSIPVLYFRSSSMNQWPYCQLSYYLTYNLGHHQPTNLKANLGTIVHKTLEILAVSKQMIQKSPTSKSKFNLNDSEIGPIDFTRKSLYTDKFVKDMLDRCFRHYTEADTNNTYIASNYTFCKDMVDSCLNINDGYYDPRNMNIVEPEKSFQLEVNEPWAKFEYEGQETNLCLKGTMDLITESSPNTLHYVDYKTGARKDWATGKMKTYQSLHDDPQLLLYYYAISQLYPQYEYIIMTIFFLRDGGPYSLCFEKSDCDKFLGMLKKRFYEIRNCNQPKPINKNRTDFRCTRLCHFYKTNWPGTNTKMCNYVENHIQTYGINVTQKELIRPGHKLGFYSEPGSTDPK